jgi:hypothetical protein
LNITAPVFERLHCFHIVRVALIILRSTLLYFGHSASGLRLKDSKRIENQLSAVKRFGATGCRSAFDPSDPMHGLEGVTGILRARIADRSSA